MFQPNFQFPVLNLDLRSKNEGFRIFLFGTISTMNLVPAMFLFRIGAQTNIKSQRVPIEIGVALSNQCYSTQHRYSLQKNETRRLFLILFFFSPF